MKRNSRLTGFLIAAGLLACTPTLAATFTASSPADSGALTLRQAILDANATAGADIINVTAATINLTTALPRITEAVTIAGQGATSTIINGASGARIFDINHSSGTVLIEKLTIRGAGSAGQFAGNGAGIHSTSAAALSLSQVAVQNNYASLSGGGLYTASPTSISQSTFSGNSAATGGAIAVNAPSSSAAVTIVNSTISGNSAGTAGAGVDVIGTQVSMTSSTVAYNNAATLGALNGAGLNVGAAGGAYSLIATLLAANNVATTDRNCGCSYPGCSFLSTGTNGVNLDTANSCNFGEGNIKNAMTYPLVNGFVERILAPLAIAPGETTSTHAIPATSPALDYANNSACPTVDQRGQARRTDSDGNGVGVCEVGAYEAAANVFVSTTPGASPGGGSSGGSGGGGGGCTVASKSSDPVMPALLFAGLAGLWFRLRSKA